MRAHVPRRAGETRHLPFRGSRTCSRAAGRDRPGDNVRAPKMPSERSPPGTRGEDDRAGTRCARDSSVRSGPRDEGICYGSVMPDGGTAAASHSFGCDTGPVASRAWRLWPAGVACSNERCRKDLLGIGGGRSAGKSRHRCRPPLPTSQERRPACTIRRGDGCGARSVRTGGETEESGGMPPDSDRLTRS
ncbi:hypothetical protein PVAP13_9NG817677 [Panicum virgatum]|uniref:Uncharacterized protein n=1 Tax=Panicum virgatum TaxID=38727 RepID=A0A8T0N3C6_PANVG|nr:hypothetical protein PVAP13_9NG817677 [Panicum virgatum]